MWQLNWTDTTLIDWHKLAEVLTYDPRQPMIFSSGVFLLLFLGFSFVYMLLQKRTTPVCCSSHCSLIISIIRAAVFISFCWVL